MENRYYHSTRGSGKLTPKEAVLRGIADDGGLYVWDGLEDVRLDLDALLKLQIAMDARRFGMESWIAILCSSLLLGLGGLFALSALYSSFLTPSVAIGIALGLDGLQNAWITMHTVRVRARKKNLSEKFGLENHEEDPD